MTDGDGIDGLTETGLEEMDLSSEGLPRLTLVQPKSQGSGRPGTFENSVTLESYSEITDVVLVRMKSQRQLYDRSEGFDGENPLKCWSDDAKVPSPNVPSPLGERCDVCPRRKWVEGTTPCKESIATIALVGKNREPHLLTFGGKSRAAALAIGSYVRANDLPTVFSTAVDLGIKSLKTQKGDPYYSISVSNHRPLSKEEVRDLIPIYKRFRDYPLLAGPPKAEG